MVLALGVAAALGAVAVGTTSVGVAAAVAVFRRLRPAVFRRLRPAVFRRRAASMAVGVAAVGVAAVGVAAVMVISLRKSGDTAALHQNRRNPRLATSPARSRATTSFASKA
jgi:hypothetical protein